MASVPCNARWGVLRPQSAPQRPYLVLAGGFNAAVNYDLLLELVRQLPSVDLILAGTLFAVPADRSLKYPWAFR